MKSLSEWILGMYGVIWYVWNNWAYEHHAEDAGKGV